MKKILFGLLFLTFTFIGFSQTTQTLSTDDGNKTVTINSNGTSEINFSAEEWAQIKGSDQVASLVRVCIRIANRHQDCNGGIGFRCRIFDCPILPSENIGRSRIQPIEIVTTDAGVTVKFTNVVDWGYLSAN